MAAIPRPSTALDFIRGRVTKLTYSDGTTERFFYGAASSGDENLLVKYKDRRGVVTNYAYDDSGRRTTVTHAAAVMDLNDNESAVSSSTVTIEETYVYLDGTSLPVSVTRAGELTEFTYDYRHRIVQTDVHPNTQTTLTSTSTYVDNQLFETEDPYGRSTFYAYDATDGRLIRRILGTVPSVNYADDTAVLNATRAAEDAPNSTSLITDYVYDAEGQTVRTVDPRGLEHHTEYDSRGRVTAQIQAALWADQSATSVSARTETDYDDQGNVVEIRHPRYFDSNDSGGYQNAKTTMTYTGRNLLASRTEAPGTSEAATEYFTYTLDGKLDTKTDFRGNDWQTVYHDCCGRVQATIDPLGHGTIVNHDDGGNLTHQAWVEDVTSHTNYLNPTDAKTLREVTTRYDERGRPAARTVWLVARGTIDPNAPPIAGEGGISASDGLTTYYEYDDDLTDSTGLDSTFSTHLTGLNLGTDSDGSARLVTNPAGERTLSISDGRGRAVRTVQLDSSDGALTQTTVAHDAVVTISGYGDVLETTSTNLLSESSSRRTDAAGRTIETVDAESKVSTFGYDANGNRLSFRDPNSVGEDCTFDELGRQTACTDTGNHTTGTGYDLAGNVTSRTDAKSKSTTMAYDARGRRASMTDRINATTQWTYDANGNELSMTDAESQTTSYEYDDANHRIKTTWPDHEAMTSPGDADYGITEVGYDGLGRPTLRTDQLGDTVTLVYDLAGRMTDREYRLRVNSPSGTIADQDDFAYDEAGRILTADKGRYGNTVTFTYDDGGRIATESLTVSGQTYTITRGYDDAGRLAQTDYPDGTTVTRSYTVRGLLEDVTYETTTVASFTYDAGGRETKRTFGNAKVTDTTYITGENLIDTLSTTGVTSFDYAYDENHNKTAETIGGVMSDYGFTTGASGYDDEDRLLNWNRDDSNLDQSWSLSDVGDWDTFTENTVQQSRTHGDAHELTSIDSMALSYDPKGNLTEDEQGIDYTWDFDNMLDEVTVPTGASRGIEGTHSYTYDALGRRVSKTVDDGSPVTTVFVCLTQPIPYSLFAGQVLSEYISGTAATDPERKYAYGTYIDDALTLGDATGASEALYYYHHNSQYSICALTDAGGSVLERYAYDPYGETTILEPDGSTVRSTSTLGNVHTYTGREIDADSSGLHYFRERYFQAELGRFAARDPIVYEDGLNLYSPYFVPDGTDPSGAVINKCKCEEGYFVKNGGARHSWIMYSTSPETCQHICCGDDPIDEPPYYGVSRSCTGTSLPMTEDESTVIGECANTAFPQACEERLTEILNDIDNVSVPFYCGTLLGDLFGASAHCMAWCNDWTERDIQHPTVPDSCLTVHRHILPYPAAGGPQHSIMVIKNTCTGQCMGFDNGFLGGNDHLFDLCELPRPVPPETAAAIEDIKTELNCACQVGTE